MSKQVGLAKLENVCNEMGEFSEDLELVWIDYEDVSAKRKVLEG
jgi:hypothetical protein